MRYEEIRRFNRYYARVLGVFDSRYLDADYSIAEIRVLGEIARKPGIEASEIAETLFLDKGYLSRLIGRLEKGGLLRRSRSARDARAQALYLTAAGGQLNDEMDRRADEKIAARMAGLSEEAREELARAMRRIESILSAAVPAEAPLLRLRRARAEECDAAMALIDQAKAYLKAQGIDQWQKGYPDRACIEGDLRAEKGYFVEDAAGQIVGYMCVDFDGEPAYDGLDGEWLTDGSEPYAVVHRLALSAANRGQGLGAQAFRLAEGLAVQHEIRSLRVDTDADNGVMRRLLDKLGYRYCGKIRFDNSEKIAFEKRLTP